MKKIIIMVVVLGVLMPCLSHSWCIEEFSRDEACEPDNIYLSTDAMYNGMIISFCISEEQAFQVINYFNAKNVRELVGKCHKESKKKKNKPEVIQKIDECIISLSPISGKRF